MDPQCEVLVLSCQELASVNCLLQVQVQEGNTVSYVLILFSPILFRFPQRTLLNQYLSLSALFSYNPLLYRFSMTVVAKCKGRGSPEQVSIFWEPVYSVLSHYFNLHKGDRKAQGAEVEYFPSSRSVRLWKTPLQVRSEKKVSLESWPLLCRTE